MKKIRVFFGYSTFPLLLLVIGLLINYFDVQLHIPFFSGLVNSNLLNPLITIIVGSVAYIIYKKQRDDYKKDAANVILLEIENAQSALKKASPSLIVPKTQEPVLPENNFVMLTESWSKFRYLFVRDLTQTEWEAISDFYSKCILFDQAVLYNDSSFKKDAEQLRVNAHRIISEFVASASVELAGIGTDLESKQKTEAVIDKLVDKRKHFENLYIDSKNKFFYAPVKPVNNAVFYVTNMNLDLSLTSVGLKLRSIAGL